LDDQIKEDVMSEACSMHWEPTYASKIMFGKRDGGRDHLMSYV